MTNEIRKSALRMLARANSLGLVSKTGAPLVVDQIEELIAADHGYRNVHAYKAALASRETPVLVQEHPDEAGNDYKLIAGKGVWIRMGRFSVHPYLSGSGVVVDIHTAHAEDAILDTASASDHDIEDALLTRHGMDDPTRLEELEAWVESSENKIYDDESVQSRLALIEKFAAMKSASIFGTSPNAFIEHLSPVEAVAGRLTQLLPSSNGFIENMGTAEDVAARLNHDAHSITTLHTAEYEDTDYDLRICKVGSDAFFEWVNQDGDPVGDMFYERTPDTVSEFFSLLQANEAPEKATEEAVETVTIYCIALEGNRETGVNWYFDKAERDAARGTLGADIEVLFEMSVPGNAGPGKITKLADRAAWDKSYLPKEAL